MNPLVVCNDGENVTVINIYSSMYAAIMVSNCCLSLYLNIAGLRQGPGKMLLGSWKVLEFFVTKRLGTLVTARYDPSAKCIIKLCSACQPSSCCSTAVLLCRELKEVIPLAWVNIPVFDYKGTLRSGEHKLYMWPVTDEALLTEELLNPIGI